MASTVDNPIAAKLFDEAVRLFAHKGYPATSTREIVEAAGVTKPMLYYYFQSKEGLLAAALAHFVDLYHERLRSVAADGALDSPEQLAQMIWAALDFCQSHKSLARLFYALYFGPDDQLGSIDLTKYTDAGHELMMQVIDRAIASGCIRPGSEEDFGMALHGMTHIWVMAALKEDRELSLDLARRVVGDLLQGFQSPARTAPPTTAS